MHGKRDRAADRDYIKKSNAKVGRAAQGVGPREKQIECNQLAQQDSSLPGEVKLTAVGVDLGVFDA